MSKKELIFFRIYKLNKKYLLLSQIGKSPKDAERRSPELKISLIDSDIQNNVLEPNRYTSI